MSKTAVIFNTGSLKMVRDALLAGDVGERYLVVPVIRRVVDRVAEPDVEIELVGGVDGVVGEQRIGVVTLAVTIDRT